MQRHTLWVAMLAVTVQGCSKKQLDPCPEEACSGHGTCVRTEESLAYCRCQDGYQDVGLTCVANCFAVDCSFLGGCIVQDNEPVCVCDQGYQGVGLECRPAPQTCHNIDCSGYGVCVDQEGQPACICQTGYAPFGLSCVPASCTGVHCADHGACVLRDGAPRCQCDLGYVAVGLSCQPSDCSLTDCSGRGACLGEQGEARCECDQGYVAVGLECRPAACEQEDCSGHGACIEGSSGLECVCDPGYVAVGLSCRPRCSNFDCSGHGACVQDVGAVRCLCDPGYVAQGQSCLRPAAPGVDGGVASDSGVDGGASGDSGTDSGEDGGASGDSGTDSGGGGDAGVPTAPGDWVLIDVSGTPFTMGSPVGELGRYADEVEHPVTLTRDFWIMATEVTQGQFEEVMGYNPSGLATCGSTCPVERVSWPEFAAYTNALSESEGLGECYSCTGTPPNVDCTASVSYPTPYDCPGYRLPTEAEWEFAARARTTTATYSGELDVMDCSASTVLEPIAWFCGNASNTTHAPGQKAANAFGLSNMLGNVWEWCHDWYGAYSGGPETDPTGAARGSGRVLRGGSWDADARSARAAMRNGDPPSRRSSLTGGRAARSRP